MTSTERTPQSELLDELRRKGALSSPAVADALAAVPRERFVPGILAEQGIEAVYRDEALVVKRDGRGMPLSSSSQPALMARMLEMLDLQPGHRVLEVGAGTGYNAALLAHIVGPGGRVTSIDIDPDLARAARQALARAGSRASVVVGDGRLGWAAKAPYDRIIVTAAADAIPRHWRDQLRDGGLLVHPLRVDQDRQGIQLIPSLRREGNRLRSASLTWGGFMPLHGGDGGWAHPPATLSAGHSSSGRVSSLVSLSGPGVARLSAATARELLGALLTGAGRALADGVMEMDADHLPLLLIYLTLRIPARRRVALQSRERLGVGLTAGRGQSLALVSVPTPWDRTRSRRGERTRWQLDAYRGEEAGAELGRLLEDWRRLRRAGRRSLAITAAGSGEVLRLRFSWR